MKTKTRLKRPKPPNCPECGAKMQEAPSYRWDCPNDCFNYSLEACQIEDMIADKKEGP